ncbi:unnamed protein product [Vitrella brassicaformis CCMP3155]|uniref:HECT domain-containing protein n=1 Tax=Vitrella brassicaformis (strain CCMP3155) TaxID=1169540 RepID=A0A0G4H277_VITBC|nr:unnamed protein product [Vitrella brassicaformis CCMP3155]|eukprot:CEM37763.1 unnamed protein product [Vitrella brassicaformis CCMP3155]
MEPDGTSLARTVSHHPTYPPPRPPNQDTVSRAAPQAPQNERSQSNISQISEALRDENFFNFTDGSFVWTFGDNYCGQVLNEGTEPVRQPVLLTKLRKQRILKVACGFETTWIIGDNGDVWAGGSNDSGQVTGLMDDEYDMAEQDEAMQPTEGPPTGENDNKRPRSAPTTSRGAPDSINHAKRLELRENQKVRTLQSGRDHTVAVLDSGVALSFGSNEFGQLGHGTPPSIQRCKAGVMRVSPGSKVQSVACGQGFTIVLMATGQLLSCGDGGQGCLGHGSLESRSALGPIPTLMGMPMNQVACGVNHCMALSITGEAYGWGKCRDGQLGLGDTVSDDKKLVPCRVPIERAKYVACGGAHSAIIARKGRLLMTGSNKYGQLGAPTGLVEDRREFAPVEALAEMKIRIAQLGLRHTLCITYMGTLLAFGCNQHGQLGIGSDEALVCQPTEITFKDVPHQRQFFFSLSSGQDHAIAVATSDPPLRVKKGSGTREIDEWLAKERSMIRTFSDYRNEKGLRLSDFPRYVSSDLSPMRKALRAFASSVESGTGVTAQELREVIDAHSLDIIPLKHQLHVILADVHTMNASFLVGVKRKLFDAEGLESAYRQLFALSQIADIIPELISHFEKCLMSVATYEKELRTSDQLRFIMESNPRERERERQNDRAIQKHAPCVMCVCARGCLQIILQCPLFSVPTSLTVPLMAKLAEVTFKLSQRGKETLVRMAKEDTTPEVFGGRLVAHVVAYLNHQIEHHTPHYRQLERIWHAVHLLQLLYLANWECAKERKVDENGASRDFRIPLQRFHLDGITRFIDVVSECKMFYELFRDPKHQDQEGHRLAWRPQQVLTVSQLNHSNTFFLAHHNLCPLPYKRKALRVEAGRYQEEYMVRSLIQMEIPYFVVTVQRDNLLNTALARIMSVAQGSPHEFIKPLKIKFENEEGVDEGGVLREFYRLITQEVLNPDFGMFVYNEQIRTIWFNRLSLDDNLSMFAFVGILLGLALYNNVLLELPFPLALYKLLQHEPIGLEDLADTFPDQAHSFQQILDHQPGEEFDAAFGELPFEVTFDYFGETKTVELTEGGSEKTLTYDNRQDYVELYTRYLLVDSVKEPIERFCKGFRGAAHSELITVVTPSELQLLMCGTPQLDFEELRKGARYDGGYTPDHPYINTFWQILMSFDQEHKRKFLIFCTGSDRAPLGGLEDLRLLIQRNGTEPTVRLPTAYTCYNALLLPEYADGDKLQKLLVQAIEQAEGFGLR